MIKSPHNQIFTVFKETENIENTLYCHFKLASTYWKFSRIYVRLRIRETKLRKELNPYHNSFHGTEKSM